VEENEDSEMKEAVAEVGVETEVGAATTVKEATPMETESVKETINEVTMETKINQEQDTAVQVPPVSVMMAAQIPVPDEAATIETTNTKATPEEAAPVESAYVAAAPVPADPVPAAPVEAAPANSAPIEAASFNSAPAISAPVISAPAISAQVLPPTVPIKASLMIKETRKVTTTKVTHLSTGETETRKKVSVQQQTTVSPTRANLEESFGKLYATPARSKVIAASRPVGLPEPQEQAEPDHEPVSSNPKPIRIWIMALLTVLFALMGAYILYTPAFNPPTLRLADHVLEAPAKPRQEIHKHENATFIDLTNSETQPPPLKEQPVDQLSTETQSLVVQVPIESRTLEPVEEQLEKNLETVEITRDTTLDTTVEEPEQSEPPIFLFNQTTQQKDPETLPEKEPETEPKLKDPELSLEKPGEQALEPTLKVPDELLANQEPSPTLTEEQALEVATQRLMKAQARRQYDHDLQLLESVKPLLSRVQLKEAQINEQHLAELASLEQQISSEQEELEAWNEAMNQAEQALLAVLHHNETDDIETLLQHANEQIDIVNQLSSVPIPKVVDASHIQLPQSTPDCELDESLQSPTSNNDSYLQPHHVDDALLHLQQWAQEFVANHTQKETSLSSIKDWIKVANHTQKETSLSSIKDWIKDELDTIKTRLLGAAQIDEGSVSLGVEPVEFSLPDSSISNTLPQGVTKTQIQTAVSQQLRLFVADRTGKLDYAAIRHGASVIKSKTSPSFVDTLPPVNRLLHLLGLRFYGYPPEAALSVTNPPGALGQCWSFGKRTPLSITPLEEGDYATLTIRLASPIRVSSVAMEHAPNSSSAVKTFRVYGYLDPDAEMEPIPLGEFTYDINSSRTLQEFAIVKTNRDTSKKFHSIKLAIDSNWGHDYTCLYRFRVHGS